MREGGFDAVVRRGRRAPVQAGRHPRRRRGPGARRGDVPARRRDRGAAAIGSGTRRGLRRRQHRDGRRPGRAPARRRRHGHRLPPHPGADAGARGGGRRRGGGGHPDQLAAHHHARWTSARSPSRSRSSTTPAGPTATGRFETLAADTVILALGQESDTAFLRERAGRRVRPRRRPGVADDADDRCAGRVRRRRRRAQRAHGHRRRRARQEGRAQHRRLAARRSEYAPGPKHDGRRLRQAQPLVLRRPRPPRSSPSSSPTSRVARLRGGRRRPDRRRTRRSRRAGACRAATASSATAAWAPARRTRSSSSDVGHRYRFDYDRVHRVRRRATGSAPCTPSRWSRSATGVSP